MSRNERAGAVTARVPGPRSGPDRTFGEPDAGPGAGFARELRRGLTRRGASLYWLHQALERRGAPASMAALIGWRSGRLLPSTPEDLSSLAAVESVLDLLPGHLAERLPPVPGARTSADNRAGSRADNRADNRAGSVGPTTVAIPASKDDLRLSGTARALTALGFEQDSGLFETHLWVDVVLDEMGAPRCITQRTVWQATRDGVDSFPVVVLVPTPVQGRSTLEPMIGCRSGPEYVDLADGVFASTLVLDRPLRRGETAVTTHRTHVPAGGGSRSAQEHSSHYEHELRRRVGEVSVTVEFDQGRIPASCRAFTRGDDGHGSTYAVELVDGLATQEVHGFGPGVVGLHWDW